MKIPKENELQNKSEQAQWCIRSLQVLLSVCSDYQGIWFFEFAGNQTVQSDKYCAQLDKLKKAIATKRPRLTNRKNVICYQNNAKPHVAQNVVQKKKNYMNLVGKFYRIYHILQTFS